MTPKGCYGDPHTGRTGSSVPTRNSVGADAYIGPPYRTPCKTPCHCEPVTDVTGVAIRSPRPLHRGITDSHDQSADWSRNDTRISSASVTARGNPSPKGGRVSAGARCIPISHSKITVPLFFSARPERIRSRVSAKGSLVCSPVFISLQATTPAAISSSPRKIT